MVCCKLQFHFSLKRKIVDVKDLKQANGYGTVYKLSGNRRRPYMVRITTRWDLLTINGKPRKKQLYDVIGYAETQQDGLDMLAEYHKRKSCGYDVLKQTVTFGELYDDVMPRHLDGMAKFTIAGYATAKKRLAPIWNMPINTIKTHSIQQIVDKMHKDEALSKRPLESVKSSASIVFEYAEQNDLVAKNYASYVKIPKIESKSTKAPFTIC